MEDEARMAVELSSDLGVLVGGVVVEDVVNDLSGRNFALDGIQESDEFGLCTTVPGTRHSRRV